MGILDALISSGESIVKGLVEAVHPNTGTNLPEGTKVDVKMPDGSIKEGVVKDGEVVVDD
ncbi:hypothetical protein A2G06_16410 (plasmid) [Geobacter anodireducens]|nr:hypothetical protein A2G06_16410 [Geobacter anodireducens]